GREAHLFWKEKLAGGAAALQLPADWPQYREDNSGAAYKCMVDSDITGRLRRLAEKEQATVFSLLLSIYILFLSRISGQEEVSCSIIAAGRDHPSLHDIIGMFVNSVIFKTRVNGQQPFIESLSQCNREIIETLQYQTYPLEKVFEEFGTRYPDIPASINMINFGGKVLSGPSEAFAPYHIEQAQDVKFDIEAYITEYSSSIEIHWAYKKKIFAPETVEYMVNQYIKMVDYFTANPGGSLEAYRSAGKKRKKRKFEKRSKT
ncbi:MAG: hypothetical protein KAW12_22185, partial [Candidatus Aminicenantes bacterium]|nr:hypothetical protein [Candidatus Aminicenantes bacterium]